MSGAVCSYFFYFTTNAQGDVTGIVDGNCNIVVEYNYDAWGKLLSTTGSLANTIGKVNPFLYRGYYFDSETGLYYLNSRYYDPQTGRFISEDGQVISNLSGLNLFSYCINNPINMQDPDGNRAIADDGSYAILTRSGELAYYDAGTRQRSIIKASTGAVAATAAGRITAPKGKPIDIKDGVWEARIDSKGTPDEHIHVYNRKASIGWYAQNADGSPHDIGKNGPSSGPPNTIKKALKTKTGLVLG